MLRSTLGLRNMAVTTEQRAFLEDEFAWVAAELSQALVDRNEDRFRTIAFWKRHVIIAALEATSTPKDPHPCK